MPLDDHLLRWAKAVTIPMNDDLLRGPKAVIIPMNDDLLRGPKTVIIAVDDHLFRSHPRLARPMDDFGRGSDIAHLGERGGRHQRDGAGNRKYISKHFFLRPLGCLINYWRFPTVPLNPLPRTLVS